MGSGTKKALRKYLVMSEWVEQCWVCSRCSADVCGWDRGLPAGGGPGMPPAQIQVLSPLVSSAARGRGQLPAQPGETGRWKVGGEPATQLPSVSSWRPAEPPPPSSRCKSYSSCWQRSRRRRRVWDGRWRVCRAGCPCWR